MWQLSTIRVSTLRSTLQPSLEGTSVCRTQAQKVFTACKTATTALYKAEKPPNSNKRSIKEPLKGRRHTFLVAKAHSSSLFQEFAPYSNGSGQTVNSSLDRRQLHCRRRQSTPTGQARTIHTAHAANIHGDKHAFPFSICKYIQYKNKPKRN